ncbi:MAG: flagellar type III secretion system pore protein FliP [Thermodesulfobacteriota bacterium]|nr:flagellar type III secretion system pore protein FliP [Thermodesulfobacteriota bacterium]
MKRMCSFVFINVLLGFASYSVGAEIPGDTPSAFIGLDNLIENTEMSSVLHIVFLLTILTLLPAILLTLTSFVRILITLSLLRQAIGIMHMPPGQIIVGLSLFLTFFIMSPVWDKIEAQALRPYLSHNITIEEAVHKAMVPLRGFMLNQTREKDLALFIGLSKTKRPKSPMDVPLRVIIPSFVISELKTAFQIGFLIYIPFLVIDIVIASVLLSMGMMMLPPIMVSLPFKLMLFVLVDGWYLIIGSLVRSFG